MKLLLASAAIAALMATAAQADSQIQQVIYNVDATGQCSLAANDQGDLKQGLAACNTVASSTRPTRP